MKNSNKPQDHPVLWRQFCHVAPRLGLECPLTEQFMHEWLKYWNFFMDGVRTGMQFNERDIC